jgi:molybdopterin-synthase adenylyltransferase
MTDAELTRYSRHILLDEWGVEAQASLAKARVLIVGMGGLGCPAAHVLAAAGVGHLTLADGDVVDATNLQRQYLHTEARLGMAKVQSAKIALQAMNPNCTITTIQEKLAAAALSIAVQAHDVVLDCTDNFATRHAINRACVVHQKPLFSGAAIRFDGQFIVFNAKESASPCYACVFPADTAGGEDDQDRCGVMGVFAPLTMQVGTLQAAAALQWLAGVGRVAVGELQLINALQGTQQRIRVPRDAACAVCGQA